MDIVGSRRQDFKREDGVKISPNVVSRLVFPLYVLVWSFGTLRHPNPCTFRVGSQHPGRLERPRGETGQRSKKRPATAPERLGVVGALGTSSTRVAQVRAQPNHVRTNNRDVLVN